MVIGAVEGETKKRPVMASDEGDVGVRKLTPNLRATGSFPITHPNHFFDRRL